MGLSGVPRKKSPVIPPGIDSGALRLVAPRLNHFAIPGIYIYIHTHTHTHTHMRTCRAETLLLYALICTICAKPQPVLYKCNLHGSYVRSQLNAHIWSTVSRIRLSYCHVDLSAHVPNNSFWVNEKNSTKLGMNVIAPVSTTVVIFNSLLLLAGYHYARVGNLHDVGKTLVSRTVTVPHGCTDRYWYNTQFCQLTLCRMSSNNIAKYS